MSSQRLRGFSLVELMVAMTLSLILLAGILSVVYSSKVTYRESERIARLQESGRTAVELMLRDIRAGGFRGCTRNVPFTTTLESSTDLLWNFATMMTGFDYSGDGTDADDWTPARPDVAGDALPGSDVIVVRTVRPNLPAFTTNAAIVSTTDPITVTRQAADTLPVGRTVVISDCNAAAVFAVSAFEGSGTTATLHHETGITGVGPGNSTADIGFEYQPGAQVVPVDTVVYYIAESDTVRDVVNPSLWRVIGSDDPQELIEGVEALQVEYGVDTDGDRIVNEYLDASAVTNWDNVMSVSFAVLIRSAEPNAQEIDKRTWKLLSAEYGPFDDRFERTIYTTTVTLRNATS
jgi:type IV pilus assembly protein PilW